MEKTDSCSVTTQLNRDCHCVGVDEGRLRDTLEEDLGQTGLWPRLLATHPHLFALTPVFVSHAHLDQMHAVVHACEAVIRNDAYRERVLSAASEIARADRGPRGAFLGYDFHVGQDGPKLIEINTNAGGALLGLYLANAQRACCVEVKNLLGCSDDFPRLQQVLVDMLRDEWRHQRPTGELRHVAIVDESPTEQFLYPELQLYQRLFERSGMRVTIADPADLVFRHGALYAGIEVVDLVYNRLTDFYLESLPCQALREAYVTGGVVVTPNPHTHALHADKRNLALLSDPSLLRDWGIDETSVKTLAAGVPQTTRVTKENAEELWAQRKTLFFKPASGYGSRGAYRGAKLTRRVWQSILESEYIAQRLIAPSERQLLIEGQPRTLKLDVRCFVYDDDVQTVGARLYQGQTTNMRTEGGGLASVFTTPVGT